MSNYHPRRMIRLPLIGALLAMALVAALPVPRAGATGPVVSASLSATNTSINGDGKASPGDTISYTLTVSNAGPGDATGVTVNDTPDSNTTLVPNIASSPIAAPDSYSAQGGVPIVVPDGNGVLGNDSDPDGQSVAVSGWDTASTNGGTISATDSAGGFTYTPPPGFIGTDTFHYTLTDDLGQPDQNATAHSDTGLVSIAVGGPEIWFVDAGAGTNGNGTLTSPFNTLASFNSINDGAAHHAHAEDVLFLYTGSYTGPLALQAGQFVIGQGATDTIANIASITLPTYSEALPSTSGTNPTINAPSGSGDLLTLSSNDYLRGFDLSDTAGTGKALTGSSFGNLTLANMSVTDNAGRAISLDTGVVTATLTTVNAGTASSGPDYGIRVNNATGSFTVSGGTGTTQDGSGGTIQQTSTGGAFFSGGSGTFSVELDRMNLTNAVSSDHASCTDNFNVNSSANLNCNGAVFLANVNGATMKYDAIDGSSQIGVNGNNVTSFSMDHSLVQNAGSTTTPGNPSSIEGGLLFSNLQGTSSITNSTIQKNGSSDLEVRNHSGTLTALSLTNDTFGQVGVGNNTTANDAGQAGIRFIGDNTAIMNVDVEGSTIQNVDGDGFFSTGNSSAHIGIKMGTAGTNAANAISTTTGIGSGINISTQGSGKTAFDIENYHIFHTGLTDVVINLAAGSNNANTLLGGTFKNNIIGTAGTAGSANNTGGHGMILWANGAGQLNALVTGNQIYGVGANGIDIESSNGNPSENVTLTKNTIDPINAASDGVYADNSPNVGDTSSLCLDAGSGSGNANNLSNTQTYDTANGAYAMVLILDNAPTFNLPGLSGSGSDTNNVAFFEAGQNGVGAALIGVAINYPSGSFGNTACSGTVPSPPVTMLALRADRGTHHGTVSKHGKQGTASSTAPATHTLHFTRNTAGFPFTIGTLPAGHSVTVTFQATVNTQITIPGSGNATNTATISGTNFGAGAGGTDPTGSADTPLELLNTTTTTATSGSSNTYGEVVTFTATVAAVTASPPATLSGTVTFLDGGTPIGTSKVVSSVAGTGTAKLYYSSLASGASSPHTVKATYNADHTYGASTDPTGVQQTVNPSSTVSDSRTGTSDGTSATAVVGGTNPGDAGSYAATATGGSDGNDYVLVNAYSVDPVVNRPLNGGPFFDVMLSHGNTFTSVTIVNCNLGTGGNLLYWYNGTAWLSVIPPATLSGGCLTFTATNATVPSISQLTGTPFSSNGGPTLSLISGLHLVHHHAGSTTVKWHLSSIIGVVGFNLTNGTTQLNTHLIRLHSSRAYKFTVKGTVAGPITLHVVMAGGGEETFTTG